MKNFETQAEANSGAAMTAEAAAASHLTDLRNIRRSRLELLIEQAYGGSAVAFSNSTGFSEAQVSQFLSTTYREGRSLGERAARNIEAKAGLQFGWLDQADGDAGIPASHDVPKSDARICASQIPAQAGMAAASVSAVRSIDKLSAMSTIPAFAGTTSAECAGLVLHPLEVYAGVVQHHGVPVHLILLPGDVRVTGLDVAEEFVASIDGEFPTYAELAHLRRSMHHKFKPELYYTCDQEPYDGDMATMLFDFATDADRQKQKGPHTVRARAVRRVPVLGEAVTVGLTEGRVAAIAEQLIDDVSRGYDSTTTDDEKIAGAGIKVGIGKMALAVQQALAAQKRQNEGAENE